MLFSEQPCYKIKNASYVLLGSLFLGALCIRRYTGIHRIACPPPFPYRNIPLLYLSYNSKGILSASSHSQKPCGSKINLHFCTTPCSVRSILFIDELIHAFSWLRRCLLHLVVRRLLRSLLNLHIFLAIDR